MYVLFLIELTVFSDAKLKMMTESAVPWIAVYLVVDGWAESRIEGYLFASQIEPKVGKRARNAM